MEKLIIVLLGLASTLQLIRGQPLTERVVCDGEKVDLVFVVDESSSIWGPDFKKQLKFIKDITEEFNVGRDKAQVAVLTFATKPTLRFYLNEHTSSKSVTKQIDGVTQTRGLTYTNLALDYVREHMIDKDNGAREQVPKIAVVITDGESADPDITAEAAKALKKTGTIVFAIGIGNDYSLEELKTIASQPDYVFTADSYRALEKIRNRVSNASCFILKPLATPTRPKPVTTPVPTTTTTTPLPTTTTPEPTTTTTPEPTTTTVKTTTTHKPTAEKAEVVEPYTYGPCCGDVNLADVVFVADSVHYGGKTGHTASRFVHDTVSDLDIAPNKVRTAMVSHECDTQTGYFFNTYRDKAATLSHFHEEPSKDDMASSIKDMRIRYFTPSKGARPGARKIAVLVVDDVNRLSYKTMDEIWRARLANIEVYVVGLSKDMDLSKLSYMASKPTSKYLFTVDENSPKQIRALLASEICRGKLPEVTSLRVEE